MASAPASTDTGKTDLERLAHYLEQAAQFRQWADDETIPEARAGLLDMVRQYERLARDLEARVGMPRPTGESPTP